MLCLYRSLLYCCCTKSRYCFLGATIYSTPALVNVAAAAPSLLLNMMVTAAGAVVLLVVVAAAAAATAGERQQWQQQQCQDCHDIPCTYGDGRSGSRGARRCLQEAPCRPLLASALECYAVWLQELLHFIYFTCPYVHMFKLGLRWSLLAQGCCWRTPSLPLLVLLSPPPHPPQPHLLFPAPLISD
jgi:hypothetical protein